MFLTGFGLGKYNVDGVYLCVVLSIEALVKLLLFTVTTGLFFSRFVRPISRIRFSDTMCIVPHYISSLSTLTLSFRVMHERPETLVNVHIAVCLSVTEERCDYDPVLRKEEVQTWRSFHDLQLVRQSLPNFALPWTVMHRIDEHSKLYCISMEELIAGGATFFVTFSAVDTVFGGTVFARHEYNAADVQLDRRFADMMRIRNDGQRELDLSLLSATEPCGEVCQTPPHKSNNEKAPLSISFKTA